MCVVFLVLLNPSSNGLEARHESADPSYVVAYPGLALVGVKRRAVLGGGGNPENVSLFTT